MALLCEIVYTIRNIRGEMKLQPGVAANVLLVASDPSKRDVLGRHSRFFDALTNIRDLRVVGAAEPPASASTGVASGVVVYLELPAEMRLQEAERLTREIARVTADMTRQQAKLADERFTAKAPASVVEKERCKLEALAHEHEQLREKLARLNS